MERKRFFFAKGYVHITNSKQRKHLSAERKVRSRERLGGLLRFHHREAA